MSTKHRGITTSLALAIALALLALLFTAWDLHRSLSPSYPGRVISVIVEEVRQSPATMQRIYAFATNVVLLYLAFGIVTWLSARLTVAAFPSLQRKELLLVVAWFIALALTVGLINADLYPNSRSGLWSRSINNFLALGFPLWRIAAPLVVFAWIGLAGTVAWKARWKRMALRVSAWSVVAIMTGISITWIQRAESLEAAEALAAPGRPNIILIGLDSLRPELVGDRSRLGYMPNLSEFIQHGHRFTDATTPLARTFPSWMAMLSGRRPTTTGIRENLMPRELVNPGTLLPQILREHGYQTIYATDEVRFSNIDTSYGFEKTLTPRIGASDFLLGRANDLPLTNLFANTRVAQWLFPDSYANRAVAQLYDPQSFVDRLDRGVVPDERPVFLALHLTLAHWPYGWRDGDTPLTGSYDSAYAYLAAVVELDKQFSSVIDVLEKKGLLRNSFVITFSDHGEGLNRASDNLVRPSTEGLRPKELPPWVWGHGTSVLSAPQFEIFLAARALGLPGFASARAHDAGVSIEDVAPSVLEIAGIDTSGFQLDGRSFAPFMMASHMTGGTSSSSDGSVPPRIRFTESAYSTPSLRQGAANESSLIEEGRDVFRINRESGWVEIRTELWDELMAVRERAAIGPTMLLASVPTSQPGVSSYFLVPRAGGDPLRLLAEPGAGFAPEARLLWNALFEEYGDELGKPGIEPD